MSESCAPCVVFTTWPADHAVTPLARELVERRLAACVQVGAAMTSVYRWAGATETTVEQPVVIKTTRASLAALEAAVRAAHPYELPEWLVVEAVASRAYGQWISDALAPAGHPPAGSDGG